MERRRIAGKDLHRASLTLVVLAWTVIAGGCGGNDEPTQPIAFRGDLLSMSISQKWASLEPLDGMLLFGHREHDSVLLSVEDQTESIGSPMTVSHVKGMLGRDLNRTYGGVVTRVSLSGNAMFRYVHETEVGGQALHTENWVLAKPHGYGDIARVAITLSVPVELRQDPAIVALIESLDRQVGDAALPPT